MLLAFGAQNFYSFKEGFEASLRLGADCPAEISHDREASTVTCVKGANASGKTNVLRALRFITGFCRDSFISEPDSKISVVPYFSEQSPSEFYIEFAIDADEYRYELAATPEEVRREELYLNGDLVVRREGGKFTTLKKSFASLKIVRLRSNASFISTAYHYEVKEVADVYRFISRFDFYIDRSGRKDPVDYQEVSKVYYENRDYLDFVKGVISQCDLGSHDIEITEVGNRVEEPKFRVMFHHRTDEGMEKLPYGLQSSGTQALYELLRLYRATLEHGHIRVVDEIEINLHPQILPVLTGLFASPKTNPKGAQLIFTTHDSAIMDILGKQRTLMVEKDNNASILYRLDEIPGDMPGKGRNISTLYKAGQIGGVPKIS